MENLIDLPESPAMPESRGQANLSYKFQRLREKIRLAIASGELAGKLPGERVLAERFGVNAKTLSKALTDLAAQGLLHRSIGRGTFVKGSEPRELKAAARWLVLASPSGDAELLQSLLQSLPNIQVHYTTADLRPSLLAQFGAVVILNKNLDEAFLRDLLIRNLAIVTVGHRPRMFSTHAVFMDSALAANELGRRLFLDGHRHVLAVEAAGETTLAQTLRESAARYAADAVVDSGYAKDVVSAVANGVTAIVCDSVLAARTAMEALKVAEISIPAQVSVAAIGRADADVPCSGCFLHSADEAAAVARLLEPAAANARPTTLWLHGRQMDRGTIAPVVTAPLLQIPQFDLQLNAAP